MVDLPAVQVALNETPAHAVVCDSVFAFLKDLVGTWTSSGIFCQQMSSQNDQADQQTPSGTWLSIIYNDFEQLKANIFTYFQHNRTRTTPRTCTFTCTWTVL